MLKQPFYQRVRLLLLAAGVGVALLVAMMVTLSGISLAAPDEGQPQARLAPQGLSNLGNYVWYDDNLDGLHETTLGEAEFGGGINGVVINIYTDTNKSGTIEPGEFYSQTVSGNDPATPGIESGWYNFDITGDGNWYIVEIDPSNFLPGGALEGLVLTSAATYPIITPFPTIAQLATSSVGELVVNLFDIDFGFAEAGVELVKTANDTPDGGVEYIQAPSAPVIYTYVYTNTGDTYLISIVITDDAGTPGVPGDDFTVCQIAGPLAPGASGSCTANKVLTGDRTNLATITGTPSDAAGNAYDGTVTDSDDAVVDMVDPAIELVKTANDTPDGGIEYVEAPSASVTYTYVVTNTGDTYLTSIVITDDAGTPGVPGDDFTVCTIPGPLAPLGSASCTANKVLTGDRTNLATATGTPSESNGSPLPDIDPVTDTDDAVVEMVDPAIKIVKTANNAPDGGIEYILAGETVTYTMAVTNEGDTPLGNVTVNDDTCSPVNYVSGDDSPNNGLLDLSETWIYECVALNVDVDTTNIADVTGTPTDGNGDPLPDIDDVTDTDPAIVDVVNPGIQVVKVVDKPIIYAGDSVVYTYTVTNTGDTVLDITSITDDKCAPLAYVSGDNNPANGFLNLTEAWIYTCSTALFVDTVNVVKVVGQPTDPGGTPLPDIDPVDDDDTETVNVINPKINILKEASATTVAPGTSVTYTYTVTNPGDDPLVNIQVTDDKCSPVTYVSGDGVVAGVLEVGEVWLYTCTAVLTEDTLNTATVNGDDSLGNPVPPDEDEEFVEVLVAGLQIQKVVTPTLIYAGESVVYTYTVTTTGTDPVFNVSVSDDKCAPVTYVSGDTLNDGILTPGEIWLYTCTTALTEDTLNTATVTGEDELGNPLDDTDIAEVNVINPDIQIVKTATPNLILSGEGVLYTFEVTNPGDDPISNVVVQDDKCSPVNYVGGDLNGNSKLEPGEGWIYSCIKEISEDTLNTATVDGVDSLGGPVDDEDDAFVEVVDPGIQIIKTAGDAADGTILYVQTGVTVTYVYSVTNTGDTPLSPVNVSDDKCSPVLYVSGDNNPANGLLNLTETWIYTCDALINDNTINVATAVGTPTDAGGNPLPGIPNVQDTDPADVQIGSNLGDFVWWDIDGDGLQDSGEPGIPNVTVNLSGPVNGTFTTDASGIYTFTNLPPGIYSVSIPASEFGPGGTLENWVGSPQNVGADGTIDSNANPVTHIALVNLPQGVTDTTIDFGFDLPSSYVITKELNGYDPFAEGAPISFTIRITNTGLSWITVLPVSDIYTTTYLSYGYNGTYSDPTSDDNINNGQIDWADLTSSPPNGTGLDLAPAAGASIVVTFTAEADTTLLPFSRTVNVAAVSGAFADPDGPGPLPGDEPLPDQQDIARVQIIKPTAVILGGVNVQSRGRAASITWRTESEANILGFRLLRNDDTLLMPGMTDAGDYAPVRSGLILARYSGANRGGAYRTSDTGLLPGSYRYVVEVVRLDGSTWRTEPTSVTVRGR